MINYIINIVLRLPFLKRVERFLSNTETHRKIAFLSPLPPAKTGTARCAVKNYSTLLDSLDFVSDINDWKSYRDTLSFFPVKYHRHVVPLVLSGKRKYEHIVLNIGNSAFHIPYFEYGIKTNGKKHRHIVLCETQICGMLKAFYKKENFENIIKQYYPDKTIDRTLSFQESLWKENIFGIRILIALTGIKHFILYRELGRQMLLADIKDSPVEKDVVADVIPLGLSPIYLPPRPAELDKSGYNIGSLGIASDIKQTDKIINAVNLLNSQGKKVTLWLAGYYVSAYAGQFDLTNVRLIENAQYDILLSLMANIDLAVQLRKFSNGEKSGCLSELIALNKNFIASDNLFEPQYKNAGVFVSSDCSVEALATAIWHELKNNTVRDNSQILKSCTLKNTADKFMEILK